MSVVACFIVITVFTVAQVDGLWTELNKRRVYKGSLLLIFYLTLTAVVERDENESVF
jgi:hypothetical protein